MHYFIEFYSGNNHVGTRSLRAKTSADAEREANRLLMDSSPNIDKVTLFEDKSSVFDANIAYKAVISYFRP